MARASSRHESGSVEERSDCPGTGDVEFGCIALLSQEGSTIETAVEIVRGVVPEPHIVRMLSEAFLLGNHPSRHRKKRDDAALLTQEGNSPAFTATTILYEKSLLDSRSWSGAAIASARQDVCKSLAMLPLKP